MNWLLQTTKSGDTLASLSKDFGVSVRDIMEANGVPYNEAPSKLDSELRRAGHNPAGLSTQTKQALLRAERVNALVASRGGRCLPWMPGSTPGGRRLAPCPSGGYAVLTDSTRLKLPNKNAPASPVPSAQVSDESYTWLWAGAALVLLAAIGGRRG